MTGISALYDGLDVRVQDKRAAAASQTAFRQWFGDRFNGERSIIYLAAVAGSERPYPVHILVTGETEVLRPSFRPTFSQVAILPQRLQPDWHWPEAFPAGTPPIVAFQSFKGGVGRTIHLLGLAAALSRRGSRVLLVDADLEAPGITWLARNDELGAAAISFVDFLALVHSDVTPNWSQSVELTAERLSTQTFRIPGSQTQHLLLPAFRDDQQMLRLEVRPENLSLGPDAVWHMTEAIASLGRSAAVDAVLVDLRAGLSELASPFLFDPRVQRVLVSTLSQQSLGGTYLVLEQLAKLAPSLEQEHLSDPAVILTFVTPEAEESKLPGVQDRLYESYPSSTVEQGAAIPRLQIIDTQFAQELLVVTSLSDVFRRVDGKDIVRKLNGVAAEWVPEQAEELKPESVASGDNVGQLRSNLKKYTEALEFAEFGKGKDFLVTPQLLNLAEKFKHESPIAVIIGPKGAGKTYTYLQLARAKTWRDFATRVSVDVRRENAGLIWPLLHSKNLGEEAPAIIKECSNSTCGRLGQDSTKLPPFTKRIDFVRHALAAKKMNETDWREHWFRLIADSLGVKGGGDAASGIVARLRERHERLVVIIDGLEEIFTEAVDDKQRVALRALLQDVPNRLKEIPDSPLGLLVFIRRDLVQAAIIQNLGQFEKLYEPYKFKWDVERAVQLVVWICERAKLPVPYPAGKSAQTVTIREAVDLLVPLWGRKLGGDKSREARTAVYVMSALADFNDEIQARDLVRLLGYAAERSEGQAGPYADRILTPNAVRSAVAPCGQKKIQEVQQENQALKKPFEKLGALQEPKRRLPFSAESVGLSGEEIRLLEANGVITKYKNGFALAENYRLGLGFKYEGRGRSPSYVRIPRVFMEDT
jgi:MinD-like ATPase involved in chromosome partitioning or flagellar assembly